MPRCLTAALLLSVSIDFRTAKQRQLLSCLYLLTCWCQRGWDRDVDIARARWVDQWWTQSRPIGRPWHHRQHPLTARQRSVAICCFNRAVIDITLCPSAATWQTRNITLYLILSHWPHYVKMWRHPLNRKYITCYVDVRGASHGCS